MAPQLLSPNPTTDTFNITGLTRSGIYTIEVTAFFTGDSGGQNLPLITTYTMDQQIAGGTILGNITDPINIKRSSNGGYLTLSSKTSNDTSTTVATRSFDAIVLPTSTPTSLPGGKNTAPSYQEKYYAFGTSIIFSAAVDGGNAGGGIGFFTDDRANVGYYLMLDTTVAAGSNSRQAVKWIKLEGGKNTVQVLNSTTEAGLLAGEIYNVDIRVKIKEFKIEMTAYINGAQITAYDKTYYNTGTKKVSKLVVPTNKITLFCTQGKIFFDYAYGKEIDEPYYSDVSRIINRYTGKFANDLIETTFGEINFKENSVENSGKEYIDEFGNTVREIRKYDVQYSAPAHPIGWDNSTQPAASILAQDWNNFSSRVWVLNNSSTTIALSDGSQSSFGLFGNAINDSGTSLVYNTGDDSDYGINNPAVFETVWIQRAEDAEALGEWIKTNIINKGKIITMSVFGNPLVQLGDIISVKHIYQKFDGSEALIVTDISHSFTNGLQTELTCRTI